MSAELEGAWEAAPDKEGGFKEELHLGPSLMGQWHQSAKTLPVTIAWFVEGGELRILSYESAGDAFNYRVKTLMVPYKLSPDRLTLTLTLDEKPTTWSRPSLPTGEASHDGARREPPPSGNAPPKIYRLVASVVDGSDPVQWVLVIITPEGYAWVTTPEALHRSVEHRVPEGATLQWVPQDTARAGDPLRTEQELDALRKVSRIGRSSSSISPRAENGDARPTRCFQCPSIFRQEPLSMTTNARTACCSMANGLPVRLAQCARELVP